MIHACKRRILGTGTFTMSYGCICRDTMVRMGSPVQVRKSAPVIARPPVNSGGLFFLSVLNMYSFAWKNSPMGAPRAYKALSPG